jgi:hypothetical protein
MKNERRIILKSGTMFFGKHSPNWSDFDMIVKVTNTGDTPYMQVGDVVKIPKSSINFDIIKPANKRVESTTSTTK